MPHSMSRVLFWAVPVGALAAGLAVAFWPRAVEVDFARAERGPLAVTVAEEGKTRIREVFVISAPVLGRALRLEVEVGDPVREGETVIAEIEPIDPEILDARTEEEARASAAAARAALALARAEHTQAQAELDFATSELQRMRELAASQTVSQRVVEDAERAFRTREAALHTALAAVEMREYQLSAAETRLLSPEDLSSLGGACPCIPLLSPADGRVLRVIHESEGVVAPGQPLVEVGDPADLEIVADFRSEDAIGMVPDQPVIIEGWGGESTLSGQVRRVDPIGFTKVSALGIEEQRVNVIVDIDEPPEAWAGLGHGFRVEARVILWQSDDVLTLPLTALFRNGGGWRVFEVRDGVARATDVVIGQRTDTTAEVVSGIAEGAEVVRYPDDRIEDGTRVVERE